MKWESCLLITSMIQTELEEEDLSGKGICFEGQGCLLSPQGLQMGDLIMPGVSNLIPRASSYPGHGKKIGISHELDAKR